MHGAALDRPVRPKRRERLVQAGTAIDDDEFRVSQAARDEVVEQRPPGRFALPAHASGAVSLVETTYEDGLKDVPWFQVDKFNASKDNLDELATRLPWWFKKGA